MTTIEDRLRDLGRAVTAPPLPGATAVMQRGRQRRHRRRGGVAALFVATGTGTAFAGNALLTEDGPSVRTAPAGIADDGSGGWEEVPSDPPTGGSGEPGGGGWTEVPSDGPPDEASSGEGEQAPAADGPDDRAETTTTHPTDPAPPAPPSEPGDLVMPDVIGLTVAQGRNVLEDLGFQVQILGDGDAIVAQDPAAATVIPAGATVRLTAG